MLTGKKLANYQDAFALLNCTRLPGRLNTTETAVLLGFQEHDIAPLVVAKLLSPLGRPAPNAPKYFSAFEIEQLAHNREWLSEATKALSKHWIKKKQGGNKRHPASLCDFAQPQ